MYPFVVIFSITAATDILGLPDLIWDAHWLYDERNAPLHVAIATAHNVVWCWEWQKGEQQCVAHCEESCILYPFLMLSRYC